MLQNLADGNDTTWWQPYADGFDSYSAVPVSDAGIPIPGAPRPAIQFDFGDRVRIPYFRPKTETAKSLGPCWLLASDLAATSIDNTVQAGDQYAGFFTIPQMNGGLAVKTLAANQNIRGRYWRFVSMVNPAAV